MTNILIGLAVVVVLFLIFVATRPADFCVARSTTIAAPSAVVFTHVNNLHKWDAWSPWAKLDPNAKQTFEGPPEGKGAAFAWAGNNKVGEGRMEIVESQTNMFIKFRLDFLKPMKATNYAEFEFKPAGAQTAVTWSMTGKNNFMGKAFSVFVNCDKMIGSQFEKGLADLKTIAEAEAKSVRVTA